ncbi:SDR family NAD(P)-dependent oxidoreductase [Runella sp. MFBS21]|uniref:SDR family NAD(P)-dependent oxidoreductase n=1 Tax=Runella sp. MFBS21 TaxID=3034018 RepID=UPI0023F8C8EF|nr:SDR family NAD(P)-dependent oxidoreductase [Runella sp. MFBS21]MDF7819948.1 SDR family NAD(P)-dependent oxidoreductase [Runella sp. MFBS21]
MSITHQYALVTGASSGIGKAIAQQLALRGYHLLLISSNPDKLKATSQAMKTDFPRIDIQFFAQDLSKTEAIKAIYEWSLPFHSSLTIIVNNAGYGLAGRFEEIPIQEQLNIIDVNLKALVELTYVFIPVLKRHDNRKTFVLNVASTTAYQSIPFFAIYTASKTAVLSFSRSLRYELRDTNISVSVLSPGSTNTDFVNRARMSEHIKKLATKFSMTPDEVATIALKGLFRGKAEIIPGFLNVLNAILPRFVPKIWVESIGSNIYKPKN